MIDEFVHRLVFAPRTAWPLAFARIGIGLIVIAWAITMMFDASTMFSPDGPVGLESASGPSSTASAHHGGARGHDGGARDDVIRDSKPLGIARPELPGAR